jgi:hypothetical protein
MPIYEKIENALGTTVIIRTDEDGKVWSFLAEPANSDYQRYLRWLENPEAEQSTPIVTADE